MGDFKKRDGGRFKGGQRGGFAGNRRGGKPNFSRGGGGRDRDSVTMHEAVCAQCGNACQVPFRPNDRKPVYCNDCFALKRDGAVIERDKFPVKNVAPQENNHEVEKQLRLLNEQVNKLVEIVLNFTQKNKEKTSKEPEEKVVPIKSLTKKSTKKISKK
jgi:CxxC-x17-CxxC domain-containing protein